MSWVHERIYYLFIIGIILFVFPYVLPIKNDIDVLISTLGSLIIGSTLIEGLFRISEGGQILT